MEDRLLPPTDDPNSVSSNHSVRLRLLFVISLGIISAWANYEASRSFSITVINEADELQTGKLLDLMYVSNDKASRILQNTSSLVESILYADKATRKQLRHITLRLGGSSNNLQANSVTVMKESTDEEFVISISLNQSALDGYAKVRRHKLDDQVISMVLEGVARVWLWDSKSRAPSWLLDGLVEYIKGSAGFGPAVECFRSSGDEDPLVVAKYLDHCEQINKGFIKGLHEALIGSDGWDYLKMEPTTPCDSFLNTSHGFQVG